MDGFKIHQRQTQHYRELAELLSGQVERLVTAHKRPAKPARKEPMTEDFKARAECRARWVAFMRAHPEVEDRLEQAQRARCFEREFEALWNAAQGDGELPPQFGWGWDKAVAKANGALGTAGAS